MSAPSIANMAAARAARKARKESAKAGASVPDADAAAAAASQAAHEAVLERFRKSPTRALATLGLDAVDAVAVLAKRRADAVTAANASEAHDAMAKQLSRLGRWEGATERAVLDLARQSDGSAGGSAASRKQKSGAELRRDWRRLVLSRVFPASDVLVHAVRTVLPPPAVSQSWRVPALCHPEAVSAQDPSARSTVEAAARAAAGDSVPTLAYVSRLLPPSAAAAAGAEGHSAGKHSSGGGSGRLLAYARVYSGRLAQGDKVWVLDDEDAAAAGPMPASDSEGGARLAWRKATVGRVHRLRGHLGAVPAKSAVAGDVVAIEGVAGSLSCRGVLWAPPSATALPPPVAKVLQPLRLVVEPVVEAALRLVDADGAPVRAGPSVQAALAAELRLMTRVDPLAKAWREATRSAGGASSSSSSKSGGRWILAGAGELHLDVCARSLSAAMGDGIEVALEQPEVQYRETVAPTPEQADKAAGAPSLPFTPALDELLLGPRCMEKSPNGHNKFEVAVARLPQAWLRALQRLAHGKVELPPADASEAGGKAGAWPSHGARVAARLLGWPAADARRVWALGPGSSAPTSGAAASSSRGGKASSASRDASADQGPPQAEPTCFLLDGTQGAAHLSAARDGARLAFAQLAASGPLSASPMQGVVVVVTDVSLHGDSTHRGPSQLAAAARRAIERAFLSAHPGLMRPCLLATAEVESSEGLGGSAGSSVSLGGIYAELDRRGARILADPSAEDEDDDDGGAIDGGQDAALGSASGGQQVFASLPASACLGLADAVKGATSGRGQLRLRFLGWEQLAGHAAVAVPGFEEAAAGGRRAGGGGGRGRKVRVADPASNPAAAAAARLRKDVSLPIAADWAAALAAELE